MVIKDIRLRVIPFDKLSLSETDLIASVVQREFGNIPIVQNHTWASPQIAILATSEKQFLGSVCLIVRQAKFDDQSVPIVGINNLITEAAARKNGVGGKLVEEAIKQASEYLKAKAVVLFCADELVAFYAKFGFQKVECDVWIDQPTGRRKWPSNCLVHTKQPLPSRIIDLCGFPF